MLNEPTEVVAEIGVPGKAPKEAVDLNPAPKEDAEAGTTDPNTDAELAGAVNNEEVGAAPKPP